MTENYPELIPNKRIIELQEEISSWKKILKCRMEANILMKYSLGNILMNINSKDDLEEIEQFQNKFIREDEITDLLRNDVAKFDDLSYSQLFKDEKMRKSCINRMKKLREEIMQSEKDYGRLTSSFVNFVDKMKSGS